MEWLEAGLAFAVTMMIFSTMVSVIMETGHRIFRIREKGLQMIMTHVYEDVIWPRLSNRLGRKEATSIDFMKQMTRTRFLPAGKKGPVLKTNLMEKIMRVVNAGQLKSLTTHEFIERLAETPAGRSLMAETAKRGKQYIKTFLEDLASKYEDFGAGATEYFKRRSKLVSVLVAVGMAFSLNVNAVHLFKTFLVNKDIRQAMIERGEDVATRLQEQEANLKKLLETSAVNEKDNLKKIEKNIKALTETANTLSQTGIPIGWDTAPWKSTVWKEYQTAGVWMLKWSGGAWLLLKWFLSVLLAGLLIGLGGPFWFDTFRKLSVLTGIVRGLQTPVQKAKEPGATTSNEPEKKPKFVTIFETTAKACTFGDVKGRMLLTPDGKIDKGEL
jgi:hypothetical protein